MPNYNKVILMGNLTRDPQLRYTPSGQAVADLRLAINRRTRTPNGERRDSVTFVDVTAWGRQAEVINEYLSKGQPIFVEGRLSLDEWTSQDGQRRSKLRVVLESFQFVSPRGEAREAPPAPEHEEEAPPSPARPDPTPDHSPGRSPALGAPGQPAAPPGADDEEAPPFEDDVPF